MKFSRQDQEDYKNYLKAQIKIEDGKPESIARSNNLYHLYRDLNSFFKKK